MRFTIGALVLFAGMVNVFAHAAQQAVTGQQPARSNLPAPATPAPATPAEPSPTTPAVHPVSQPVALETLTTDMADEATTAEATALDPTHVEADASAWLKVLEDAKRVAPDISGITQDALRRSGITLPPCPKDVQDLQFCEVFAIPYGPHGAEYTQRVRSLVGTRVRMAGFMVRRMSYTPGQFMLTPIPITLHDSEMGPCDELPLSTTWVEMPGRRGLVRHLPGPLLVIGTLEIDSREEHDGRFSHVRLALESVERLTKAPQAGEARTDAVEPAAHEAKTPTRAADHVPSPRALEPGAQEQSEPGTQR